jgi:hypothetical protein
MSTTAPSGVLTGLTSTSVSAKAGIVAGIRIAKKSNKTKNIGALKLAKERYLWEKLLKFRVSAIIVNIFTLNYKEFTSLFSLGSDLINFRAYPNLNQLYSLLNFLYQKSKGYKMYCKYV